MIRVEVTTAGGNANGLAVAGTILEQLAELQPEVGEFVTDRPGHRVRVAIDEADDGPTYSALEHVVRYLVPTIPPELADSEDPQHVAVRTILEALGIEHEPEPGDDDGPAG